MDYLELRNKIKKMKQEYGRLITNDLPGLYDKDQQFECYCDEKGVIAVWDEAHRKRGVFYAVDKESFMTLMKKAPIKNVVFEYVYREDNDLDECLQQAGLSEYAKYVRVTNVYKESPYSLEEVGRRKILSSMYDKDEGEFANIDDIDELYNITYETFDPICDDVFTKEQWKEVIERQNCMLYKENGEIVAYYVWREEGKKIYSNVTVNRGAANHLYNIERKVFEDYWDKGFRIFYAWFNVNNKSALMRGNERLKDILVRSELIYNSIFIKE